jgi:hypothetical protein
MIDGLAKEGPIQMYFTDTTPLNLRIMFKSHSASYMRRLIGKNNKMLPGAYDINASICLMTNSVLLMYPKPQSEHTLNYSGVPRHFSSLTTTMFNFCVPTSTVGYAKISKCYNEVFINKIRMLQGMWWNTISWFSTHVCMTCRAFLLWLQHQSSSLLSFVRFSYQLNSVSAQYIS